MSIQKVSIKRADGLPSCELWDGRKVKAGDVVPMTAPQAADLVQRDPADWKVAGADATAVAAEIKRRDDGGKKTDAVAAEGGN